jgi:hypothetical protein
MEKDGDSLIPLKDVIANILSDGTLPFNPDDANIWKIWDRVVGPAISKNARPLWIKNGKLKVTVADPIWLQELKFVEKDIREKLNGTLGRKAIDRIEFRIGAK